MAELGDGHHLVSFIEEEERARNSLGDKNVLGIGGISKE